MGSSWNEPDQCISKAHSSDKLRPLIARLAFLTGDQGATQLTATNRQHTSVRGSSSCFHQPHRTNIRATLMSELTDQAWSVVLRLSHLSIAEWMNLFACAVLLAFVVVMARR